MKKLALAALFANICCLWPASAFATCRIHNDTKYDFKVESGNVSNQSVGAHTTTSIAAGKIKGKDEKNGKTIGGECKDGDELEVTDSGDDIPVLEHK